MGISVSTAAILSARVGWRPPNPNIFAVVASLRVGGCWFDENLDFSRWKLRLEKVPAPWLAVELLGWVEESKAW